MSEVRRWGIRGQGHAEPAAVCQGMRGRAVPSSSSASHQRVAIVISNSRTCIRGGRGAETTGSKRLLQVTLL